MAFTDIKRENFRSKHRTNVLESLLAVLPSDESAALKALLDDHTIAPPTVRRLILAEGENPADGVPEFYYRVGESTIRRYRERRSAEVNGL